MLPLSSPSCHCNISPFKEAEKKGGARGQDGALTTQRNG
jgi:hypothetical protein